MNKDHIAIFRETTCNIPLETTQGGLPANFIKISKKSKKQSKHTKFIFLCSNVIQVIHTRRWCKGVRRWGLQRGRSFPARNGWRLGSTASKGLSQWASSFSLSLSALGELPATGRRALPSEAEPTVSWKTCAMKLLIPAGLAIVLLKVLYKQHSNNGILADHWNLRHS